MDLFELRSGKDEKSFLLYNFKASFLSFTVDTQSSVRWTSECQQKNHQSIQGLWYYALNLIYRVKIGTECTLNTICVSKSCQFFVYTCPNTDKK